MRDSVILEFDGPSVRAEEAKKAERQKGNLPPELTTTTNDNYTDCKNS